jgi:hypothetical protein
MTRMYLTSVYEFLSEHYGFLLQRLAAKCLTCGRQPHPVMQQSVTSDVVSLVLKTMNEGATQMNKATPSTVTG